MRKQLALAASAALALGMLLAPQSAVAATTAKPYHNRLLPVATSNQYVVYRQQVTNKDLQLYPYSGGSLYAVGADHKRISLPGFDNRIAPPKLVADSLVQAKVTNYGPYQELIHYRNLTTGQEATVLGDVNDSLASASLGGWVMFHTTDKTADFGYVSELRQVNYDGTQESYGTPFPEGESFAVTGSNSGLIATNRPSDENHARATVRFMSWNKPGQWRTLYSGARDASVGCAPAAARWVACNVTGFGSKGLALISTGTQPIHWLKNTHPGACQKVDYATAGDNLVAIETSDAGVCDTGKLYRFNADTSLASSKTKRYNVNDGINSGLYKIIVGKSDQSRLYSLTGVTRTPVTVAQ
jgi:hypothetical protein